jgi:hypothetical protein
MQGVHLHLPWRSVLSLQRRDADLFPLDEPLGGLKNGRALDPIFTKAVDEKFK